MYYKKTLIIQGLKLFKTYIDSGRVNIALLQGDITQVKDTCQDSKHLPLCRLIHAQQGEGTASFLKVTGIVYTFYGRTTALVEVVEIVLVAWT